ncbi:MAG TPA: ClbS/DfsB family four-helix bundle protein [Anaerolineae bacterium]|nr:ClbS/DfsB family four-helix bundle protein [Anaerolineae bacterium]
MANLQNERLGKAELLARIHHSRLALEERLGSLNEAQLTIPGTNGWSIRDHVAHLATWEFGVAELLRDRPRFAAMQVEEAVSQGKSEEEVNELIYQRHAGRPPAEVMEEFQEAHRQLLEALEALGDEDLYKPYASFVPGGGDHRLDPVIKWIVANTYEHFDEHHGYIRALLQGTPTSKQ